MSLESARAFVERMATDAEFKDKVIYCKDMVERKRFAADAGYEFLLTEVIQAIEERRDSGAAEAAIDLCPAEEYRDCLRSRPGMI